MLILLLFYIYHLSRVRREKNKSKIKRENLIATHTYHFLRGRIIIHLHARDRLSRAPICGLVRRTFLIRDIASGQEV